MCLCVAGFRQRSEVVVNPRFTNGFVTPMRLGPPPRSFAPMRMAASWYRSYRIAEYKVPRDCSICVPPASSPLVVRKRKGADP